MEGLLMKRLLAFSAALMLTIGCATRPPVAPEPAADVLILAPQGVDPAVDTVGFNALVSNVTQAFSAGASAVLRGKGYSVANVLDQSPALDVGRKLAIHSSGHRSPIALVVTLESETVEQDSRLYLQIQYVQQELLVREGRPHGVRPVSVLTRRYLLRSTVSGDYPGTMDDVVGDFFSYLRQQGRVE